MALQTSTPISLTDIDAEFGLGVSLAAYKGIEVITFDGNLTRLPTKNLYMTDFLGVSKVPPEQYSPATILLKSLQSNYSGFYNSTSVQVSTGISVTLPTYPRYRPKPTRFETQITWFKWNGSQWVSIGFTDNELITLQPTDANAGLYKVETRHTAFAPSDQNPHSRTAPGPELAVVTAFTSKRFEFSVSEFVISDPVIAIDKLDAFPKQLQVVDFESATKTDTSGSLTHSIGTVQINYVNGTNFGRPFATLPSATIVFQYSEDFITWVDMKTAGVDKPSPVTDPTWPGPTFREYSIFPTTKATPATGIINSNTIHTWSCSPKFRMDNFAYDSTKTPNPWWHGYYFRIKITASATYDVAGVNTTLTSVVTTPGQQLKLKRSFVQNNNQCPESQNIKVALPVNGTKTVDMADIVSDPDGEAIAIDSIGYLGVGTYTQSGTQITLNMAGTNEREPQVMEVDITDNSTRPGGPCVKTSTITWTPGNTPPVNGGYDVTINWSPPDPAINVVERNFSLLRNSFDVNFDTMTIDEASLPNSIKGVAEGFGTRVNGTKLGMTFNKGYAGLTEFQYKVKDSHGALSEFNTASILVKTTNVAPFISDAEIFVQEATTNTLELFSIMGMSDFEGGSLAITKITPLSGNNGATISLNNNTTIDIDATSVLDGTQSRFGIRIADLDGATRDATLTVTTSAESCPLVTVNNIDLGTILNNTSVNLQQLCLNSATNGASINDYSFEVFELTNNGLGRLSGFTYSGIGDLGAINLSFRIKNSCGSVSSSGNITGTLIADNVAPIANNFTKNTDHATNITIDLTAFGSDEDGDTLSVFDVKHHGQRNDLSLNGNNLTVIPGSKTKAHTIDFIYRLSDGQALSAWANGSVKVAAAPPPLPTFSIDSNNTTEGRDVIMTITLLGANVGGKIFAYQFKEHIDGTLTNTVGFNTDYKTPAGAKDGDTFSFKYKTAFDSELHSTRTVTCRIVAGESKFIDHDQSLTVTIANESPVYGDTFKKVTVDEGEQTPTGVGVYAKNVNASQRDGWTWQYPTLTGDQTGSFNLVWDSNVKLYRQEIRVTTPAYPNNYEDQVGVVTVFKPSGVEYGKFTVISKNTDIALSIPAITAVDKFDVWTEDSTINPTGPFARSNLTLSLDGTYNDGSWSGGVFTPETWASNPPFDSGWKIQTRNVDLTHSGDTNPPIFATSGLTFRIAADYEPQLDTIRQWERQHRNNMIGMPIGFSVRATGQYRVIWSEDTSKVSSWASFSVGLSTDAYAETPHGPPVPVTDPVDPETPPAERELLDSTCERTNGVNTGYRIDTYNIAPKKVRVYDVSKCPLPAVVPPAPTVEKVYCEQDKNGNTGVLITEMSDGTVNRNNSIIVCPLPAPAVTVTKAYCENDRNGENTGYLITEFSNNTSTRTLNKLACPLPATPPANPTVVREYCEQEQLARGRIRQTGTLIQVLSNGLTRSITNSPTCPAGIVGGGPGPSTGTAPREDDPPASAITTTTQPVKVRDTQTAKTGPGVDNSPNAEVTVRDNVASVQVGNQNKYTNGLNFRGGGPNR